MSRDYLEYPTVTLDMNGAELTWDTVRWLMANIAAAQEKYDTPFINIVIKRARAQLIGQLKLHADAITPPLELPEPRAFTGYEWEQQIKANEAATKS